MDNTHLYGFRASTRQLTRFEAPLNPRLEKLCFLHHDGRDFWPMHLQPSDFTLPVQADRGVGGPHSDPRDGSPGASEFPQQRGLVYPDLAVRSPLSHLPHLGEHIDTGDLAGRYLRPPEYAATRRHHRLVITRPGPSLTEVPVPVVGRELRAAVVSRAERQRLRPETGDVGGGSVLSPREGATGDRRCGFAQLAQCDVAQHSCLRHARSIASAGAPLPRSPVDYGVGTIVSDPLVLSAVNGFRFRCADRESDSRTAALDVDGSHIHPCVADTLLGE